MKDHIYATKLEQAARQALEALKWSAPMSSTREAKQQYIEAYAALRDALAEQAEQEPIMRKTTRDEKIVRPGVYEVPVEQPPQNPVDVYCGEVEGIGHRVRLDVELPIGTKLYAAPVRTKDLTDDEIEKAFWGNGDTEIEGCRAVIAADREKNK